MSDYDWFEERRAQIHAEHQRDYGLREEGFYRIYFREDPSIVMYECHRGCGAVVHDPAAHAANVCRKNDG